MLEPKTHDFSVRCWGHNYGIREVVDGGQGLKLYGWGRGIVDGDFLILRNGGKTTRYRVVSVRYEQNPPDMWFAEAAFAPRAVVFP